MFNKARPVTTLISAPSCEVTRRAPPRHTALLHTRQLIVTTFNCIYFAKLLSLLNANICHQMESNTCAMVSFMLRVTRCEELSGGAESVLLRGVEFESQSIKGSLQLASSVMCVPGVVCSVL